MPKSIVWKGFACTCQKFDLHAPVELGALKEHVCMAMMSRRLQSSSGPREIRVIGPMAEVVALLDGWKDLPDVKFQDTWQDLSNFTFQRLLLW